MCSLGTCVEKPQIVCLAHRRSRRATKAVPTVSCTVVALCRALRRKNPVSAPTAREREHNLSRLRPKTKLLDLGQGRVPRGTMITEIDRHILRVESELTALRQQKLALLQRELDALTTAPAGVPARRAASSLPAQGAVSGGRGRRRRKRWQRFSDEEAIAALSEAVRGAGEDGMAGKQASSISGVSYPRAIKLLDANFTKSGSGKWTRYTAK